MLATIRGSMNNAFSFIHDLCTNPKHSRWICPLLLLGDIFLCALIIWRIPYTNIDWSTYMQQISLVLSGERDYTAIKGSTGPLVYPAGHVYIYSFLHRVTDGGQNVLLAQGIFAILYLATLSIVMACYRSVDAPPYIFPLLVLSKRLHSVFLLRLFNDGFATFFLWGATYLLLRRQWARAVIVWSAGVSVKMTLLLVAPALAVILTFTVGLWNGIGLGAIALLLQGSVAAPFLQENAQGYFARAFEFTRQFLFVWTVNWRFIGEDLFLSRPFSVFLLITHAALLLVFLNFFWIRPSNRPLGKFIQDALRGNTRYPISNSFIATTMMSSMVVGLLCARSLHYQFFAYLAWASPLLLWKSGLNPVLIYLVWAAQEWAWNMYPSTAASSITVILCLSIQVVGVLWNRQNIEHRVQRGAEKEHAQ